MCLAVPAKVIELLENEQAKVEVGGIEKVISHALVEGVQIGDYVVVHVGFALSKLDEKEALKTLELFKDLDEFHQKEDEINND